MNPGAFLMMVTTMSIVTSITLYFFVKVLRTPPKPDRESTERKEEERPAGLP